MKPRKYGVCLNYSTLDFEETPFFYRGGFKVFEITISESDFSDREKLSKNFQLFKSFLPIEKDDEIEIYLRVPFLTFTDNGNCKLLKDILEFCKGQEIKKLVVTTGDASGNEAYHKYDDKKMITQHMRDYHPLCSQNEVKIFWESCSGYGSIRNITNFLQPSYAGLYRSKFNLEKYEKYEAENEEEAEESFKEICKQTDNLFFTDSDFDHKKILELTKGKTVFLNKAHAYPLKISLIKEDS